MQVNFIFEKKKFICFPKDHFSKLLVKYEKKKLGNQHNYQEIKLNYNFVSKKTQKKINTEYLNHNYNTDIITFNLSNDSDTLIGDIYISIDAVVKNARIYNEERYQEIHRVIIHGLLHLLGWDDKDKKDRKVMKKEEEKYLNYTAKFVPRGTN